MSNSISLRLVRDSKKIMSSWEARTKAEVEAAHHQESLALQDSLPEYLVQLASALSTTVDRTEARKKFDLDESTRVGKKHGRERAGSLNYTMDQLIFEYHILRQVIFDVLEEGDEIVTPVQREIIVCSIEQAVNDAATQYSDTLTHIQEYLMNTLAHDLRNPITSAKMGAQLILRKADDPDQCIKVASRIANSLDRLDSMIHDLLDASRLRAGQRLPLKFEECDLRELTQQLAEDFGYTHEQVFRVEAQSAVLGIWSKNGLSRAIENLFSNAVKYGSPKADVLLTLTKTANGAAISVHNEGNPISLEDQSILFQQFRRSKAAEKKPGWGIGLTVVKGIAEAHGGTVKVKSSENEGTTFILEIPNGPK